MSGPKTALIAVLASAMMWTAAQCVARCAGESNSRAGTASSMPPCHHKHAPGNQDQAHCSDQRLPQAEAPLPPLLMPVVATIAIHSSASPLISILSGSVTSLLTFEAFWPPGQAAPTLAVLRI